MRSLGISGALLPIFLGASLLLAGQDRESINRDARSINDLIHDLGSPVFPVREKAQDELWNRGDAAVPPLEQALHCDNPEIVRRAGELLNRLSWGVRADTPPEVVNNLRRFKAGDIAAEKSARVRTSAIEALLKQGPRGVAVVRAILANNLPRDLHELVVSHITTTVRREVPRRLFEGKVDEAADLISLHLSGTNPEGAADYAAFQILNGKTAEAITAAAAPGKSHRDSNTRELILAHLYRAAGDWSRARAAAAEVTSTPDSPNLVHLLREDEGDWQTLADTMQFLDANHPDAVRLTLLRLAGRPDAFNSEAARVKREVAADALAPDVLDSVVALFSNHRVEDGTRLLLDHRVNLGLLAETLIARLRYKEALALPIAGESASPTERLAFDLRRARLLVLAGKRDEAVQLFNAVAAECRGELKSSPPREKNADGLIRFVRSMIRSQVKIGLKELAFEHAALFLSSPFAKLDDSTGESLFETLFGPDAIAAEALFWSLRDKKTPSAEAAKTMTRVRELLNGRTDQSVAQEAIAAIQDRFVAEPKAGGPVLDYFPSPEVGPQKVLLPRKVRGFLAIAAVNRAAGRDAEAIAAYQSAAESMGDAVEWMVDGPRTWVFGTSDASRPWVEWGDFLLDRGRSREAAARFEDGWRKFPGDPFLLFLSGHALEKAGDAAEGHRRMELAHWIGLGQERIRGRFLDELVRRGLGKAAQRETELILRACWSRNHYFGNVMNQASRAAALNHDFATAERCVQRSLLVILKTPGVYFVETSAYFNVPQDMLVYRARARLSEGKIDEAVSLAREALAGTPGHIDLVSGMVAELDRLGKTTAADELFAMAWSAYQKVLVDFPDSAFARNALASLAANCRRQLDEGEAYAQAAVAANPGCSQFRETLAEVSFRRGERDQAVAAMGKLLEEEPRNRLYKRQLTRYRSAALDSPKPEREDE